MHKNYCCDGCDRPDVECDARTRRLQRVGVIDVVGGSIRDAILKPRSPAGDAEIRELAAMVARAAGWLADESNTDHWPTTESKCGTLTGERITDHNYAGE